MLLANVGVVNVAIDHIGHRIPHLATAQGVGSVTNGFEAGLVLLLEQNQSSLGRNIVSRQGLVKNLV